MHSSRVANRILGALLWVAGLTLVGLSAWTVHARSSRPAAQLIVEAPAGHGLTAGDAVYCALPSGLRRIGEVARIDAGGSAVVIDILPSARDGLDDSSYAVCWRTPLSTEDALSALLPPETQQRVLERLALDWQERRPELLAIWRPLAKELASAYVQTIAKDFGSALRVREEALLDVARDVAHTLQAHWPQIQQRLHPILLEHLTPVLSRLMDEALDQAPKTRIAWHLYRNNSSAAFDLLLQWQTRYLSELSEADRASLTGALRVTWEAARADPELAQRFAVFGRDLCADPQLIGLLERIYRETIADNPKTLEFFRSQVLSSPTIQQEFFRLVEWFGPTARTVVALCLFEEGRTRPEIVHLLRSLALNRNVAWITVETPGGAGPREARRPLPAVLRGRKAS